MKIAAEKIRILTHRIVKEQLKTSGAYPNSERLAIQQNPHSLCGDFLLQNKQKYVYLLHQYSNSAPGGNDPMCFSPKCKRQLKVKLAASAYSHDIPGEKCLSRTDYFRAELNPEDSLVHTVFQNRLDDIAEKTPSQVERSQIWAIFFHAIGSSESLVFLLNKINSQGRTITVFYPECSFLLPIRETKYPDCIEQSPRQMAADYKKCQRRSKQQSRS